MASTAIRDLQYALLPAAIGSIAAIYSNISCMGIMGKIRYADKDVQVHPYKPWADKAEKAEPHFRGFKACQNCTEWTVYTVPLIIFATLYAPTIPVAGVYLHWAPAILGCGFGYYNIEYTKGYIHSAEGRIPGFSRRTMCVRGLFYLLGTGIVCNIAQMASELARA